MSATAVGLVAAGASTATAWTQPTITAELGSDYVSAKQDVTVIGSSHTDADAFSESTQGGLLNLQDGLTANSSDFPTVNAKVLGGFVHAGGTLTISGTHGGTPVQYSDGTIINVNTSTETLTFNGDHGLQTGSAVVYQAPAPANSIGGLVTRRDVRRDRDRRHDRQAGHKFTFGASTQGATIDAATAALKFTQPHNLHTATASRTSWLAGTQMTGISGGVASALGAGPYYVTVVSPTIVRLSTSAAPTNTYNFSPGAIGFGRRRTRSSATRSARTTPSPTTRRRRTRSPTRP